MRVIIEPIHPAAEVQPASTTNRTHGDLLPVGVGVARLPAAAQRRQGVQRHGGGCVFDRVRNIQVNVLLENVEAAFKAIGDGKRTSIWSLLSCAS